MRWRKQWSLLNTSILYSPPNLLLDESGDFTESVCFTEEHYPKIIEIAIPTKYKNLNYKNRTSKLIQINFYISRKSVTCDFYYLISLENTSLYLSNNFSPNESSS